MDEDGQNVTPIAPMNISSALHPTILRDGRIMFSTHESQGLRDRRLWGIWSIWPDGRNWGPIVSAFNNDRAFHFMTQLGNSRSRHRRLLQPERQRLRRVVSAAAESAAGHAGVP